MSKKLTAIIPAVNNSVKKKINWGSFNSKGKFYNSKEFDEKSLMVESETTETFNEKSKYKKCLAQKIHDEMSRSKTVQAEKYYGN